MRASTRASTTRVTPHVGTTLMLLALVTSPTLATPFSSLLRSTHHFAPNTGAVQPRNIRNLECVSRKTQEKGICMFALSCLKLNGTHLGVCVDRFYYGSCCRLPESQEEIDLGAGDSNDINNAGSVLGLPGKRPVTAASVAEEEDHSSSTSAPSTTLKTPQSTQSIVTTTKKPSPVTSRPTAQPTTQKITTKPVTASATTAKPTSKPSSQKPAAATTAKPVTQKPVGTTTKRPATSARPVTVAKPTNTTSRPVTKPTVKPVTSPPKPVSSATNKPVSSPPKPVSSPPKPVATSPKPVTSTPKPVSAPTKPASTSKPATAKPVSSPPKPAVTQTTKPSTAKPTATTPSKPASTKPTSSKPAASTTQKPAPTTTISNEVAPSSIRPSQGPVEAVEEETNVVSGTKPSITIKPTPPTFPAISSTVSTGRPTPPTFPRPGSSTTRPTATTLTNLQTSTSSIDGENWVQLEVSTTSSATTPSGSGSIFGPGSMVTEEIPTSSSSPAPISPPTFPSNKPVSLPSSTEAPDEDQSLNMTDYKQVCGRRLIPDGRIVGGTRSSFGKWPWQISLRQWRTSTYLHKCGAALLNENWAITAAHCVENVPPSDLLLRLGEHDLSTESEAYSHLERRVQIVASHPQFDSRTFEYDLALLRFYEPVDFKPNVVPICIPDNDKNFVGSNAFVTGWGRLYEDGPLPSVMQEVSVPVIENAMCETMYRSAGYIEHIPNIFICAGWKKGGFDSCEGDSGGPMVIQREDKRWVLAGVISWGIGCAEPNQPGVYTRISEFRDWINQILQF